MAVDLVYMTWPLFNGHGHENIHSLGFLPYSEYHVHRFLPQYDNIIVYVGFPDESDFRSFWILIYNIIP